MVSIIVPAYNAERYIGQALQSVLAQTMRDWELIVVEDASEDGTKEQVRRFAETMAGEAGSSASGIQDGKLRILENETNRGAAFCRNRGISAARGEWIAFLDSDDMWEPDKLEKQLRCAARHPDAGLLFAGSAFMDGEGKFLSGQLSVPERIDLETLLKQNVISCSSVLVRRDLLLRCRDASGEVFPDTRRLGLLMHEDFPVWIRALRVCGLAYGVNEPLLVYRMQRASQSGNKGKAARMTWQVYRYLKLPLWSCAYYFCCYAWRSVRKYRGIGSAAHES